MTPKKKKPARKTDKTNLTKVKTAAPRKRVSPKNSIRTFTKLQQVEAMKAYRGYWDNYLKGDVKLINTELIDELQHIYTSSSICAL